jgi:hypothetical protein
MDEHIGMACIKFIASLLREPQISIHKSILQLSKILKCIKLTEDPKNTPEFLKTDFAAVEAK